MRASHTCFGLLATLALAGRHGPAGAQPVGEEFQVNTYATGVQQSGFSFPGRVVASDASGNFVVVWESEDQDGSDYGVFGQRYDSAGDAQGAEFRVNSSTTNQQEDPSIAIGASGGFVVVWDTTPSSDIVGPRFDAAGNDLGPEFRVNSSTAGFQYNPSVASDASGDFVVAWASTRGAYGDPIYVVGQRYGSDGAAQGHESVSSHGSPPSVASDAEGNFVVVWQNNGSYGGRAEVYGRRFDSAGAPLGPQFQVNTYDSNSPNHASVASDATGNFVVAWSSYLQDGDNYGIFGQRYASDGAAQGDEFQISMYTTGNQKQPAVGAMGVDQFVVAWTSYEQDGDDDGMFARAFDFAASDAIMVVSPNTNVKWRIGSLHNIQWTHSLGLDATFRIELDRADDGSMRSGSPATWPPTARGSYAWTVSGPPSANARVRVSWTDDLSVSDASDVTFRSGRSRSAQAARNRAANRAATAA